MLMYECYCVDKIHGKANKNIQIPYFLFRNHSYNLR